MTIIIKTVGTLLVTVLLTQPLWAPGWGAGVLGETAAFGMPGAVVAVAGFFGLVAVYCRALQRTLTLIRDGARAAAPASVWWMFAIPYNFTEDFFIVRALTRSMTADGRLGAAFIRRWAAAGYGACVFQIVSLVPGPAAYVGGAVALPLWATHWIMTVRANRTLDTEHQVTAPLPSP
ncbi:hypothetical protein [Streptomyces katsurahamanus]|uniref:DUF4328 domain-containing protein n=1 Tax=Streptomyces katsurahamanus TaxID=2577098 RepID=A0ABW9NXL1_9ACTN|nr:hypothetical protein [Streptomyces katsurahamanus]MQS37789.1 hypothetical protein [Streptomyces katsurahamanus]